MKHLITKAVLLINQRWQVTRANNFIRSVTVLVGGTAFAQAITVLILPILTRLYDPEDFALLAVYAAILGIVSIVACLRLDIAIPLPEKDEDAASLLFLALLFSALVGMGTALIFSIWQEEFAQLIRQPELRSCLWLLPLGIWLASSYSAFQFWMTRKKNFTIVAKTRIVQALLGAGTQVGAGFTGMTPHGLLVGHLILSGSGVLGLALAAGRQSKLIFRLVTWSNICSQLKTYKKFPKYSTFEAFANNFAMQFPLIIIAAVAVGPEAGYLLLATRIMASPMTLLGGSIAQVYLSRAPAEYRAGTLGEFTENIVEGLLKTGVGPLIFIGIVSPVMFPMIFGQSWVRAGELVALMVPWMVFQFIASPISMVMHVKGRQKEILILMLAGVVIRVGWVAAMAVINVSRISEAYILSGALFYMIYCVVNLNCANVSGRRLVSILSKSMPILGVWAALGFILLLLFSFL